MLLGISSMPPKGIPRRNICSFPFQAPSPGQLQACLRKVLAAEGRPTAATGPDHQLPSRDLRSGCLPQSLPSLLEPSIRLSQAVVNACWWARTTWGSRVASVRQGPASVSHTEWRLGVASVECPSCTAASSFQNLQGASSHDGAQPRMHADLHAHAQQHGHPRHRAAGSTNPPMRRRLLLVAQLQGQLPARPPWQSLPCEDQLAYWHRDHEHGLQPGSSAPCQQCCGLAGPAPLCALAGFLLSSLCASGQGAVYVCPGPGI